MARPDDCKSERLSTVEEPFKGFKVETNRTQDIITNEANHNDQVKSEKYNEKSVSDVSKRSLLIQNNKNKMKNINLFKTFNCSYIEPLYVNSDTFEGTEEDISDVGTEKDLHKAHLIQTLLGIQYVNSLNMNDYQSYKSVYLPPSKHFSTPETTKTIIFDLGNCKL